MDLTLHLILFLCFWACYLLFEKQLQQRSPLHPGPTPLPIIGNILQFKRKQAVWETISQWSDQYGPIMSFKVASRTIIVLSTNQAIRDVLEKTPVNSSRPRFIGVNENLTRSMMPIFLPISDKWKAIHRVQLSLVNSRSAKGIAEIQLLTAKQHLFNMLENANYDIADHINRFTSNVVSTVLFGTNIGSVSQAKSNGKFGLADQFIASICVEHALVDLFPILEHIPGVARLGASKGNAWFESIRQQYTEDIQRAINSPTWSMIKAAHQQKIGGMSEDAFRMWNVEMEFALGMTSSMMIANLVAMAVSHSHEFRQVQSEIDRVVGPERLPTADDLAHLPRLHAFVKEGIRVAPIVPFSVPHAAVEENEYMGYRIPVDAIILPNQWHINREPKYFEDPAEFKPQRWIDNPNLPGPALFGYGIRICPGRQTANNGLLIVLALMAWGFDLNNAGGVKEPPNVLETLIMKLPTSSIRYSCRSSVHRDLIQKEWLASDDDPSSILNTLGSSLGF
ncbi:cytochrome P450 CYP2 subfamily [Aspergillus oryzae 100-8]|uniref:Cytochrome protein n=1 Tax=Aspergillus oryzae (strain 3.042) TaxID=1160506 RepID=I8TWF0_ASPO3|nr:cytochrome protein [Aspergillus oryzae 3.042]KDE84846.1 cytochrome P450 CYP2 subfamily [Aspergillus oryzae 100-8]|eukprot:EIT78755.1 cytochrome protein [Aspergillus oryzae 3.042]